MRANRLLLLVIVVPWLTTACHSGASQADQLDKAANQADPAAADVMRNEADQIRENGSDANISAPSSPVQSAMQNAGEADANASTSNNISPPPTSPQTQAKPHHAGDTVPPPQTR